MASSKSPFNSTRYRIIAQMAKISLDELLHFTVDVGSGGWLGIGMGRVSTIVSRLCRTLSTIVSVFHLRCTISTIVSRLFFCTMSTIVSRLCCNLWTIVLLGHHGIRHETLHLRVSTAQHVIHIFVNIKTVSFGCYSSRHGAAQPLPVSSNQHRTAPLPSRPLDLPKTTTYRTADGIPIISRI